MKEKISNREITEKKIRKKERKKGYGKSAVSNEKTMKQYKT